jgi:hypothetical protein
LPEPTDSRNLISQVTNLDLLAGLVADLTADRRCEEDAFEQGMYAGGPKIFLEFSPAISKRSAEFQTRG